jgi:hypothetical protein
LAVAVVELVEVAELVDIDFLMEQHLVVILQVHLH